MSARTVVLVGYPERLLEAPGAIKLMDAGAHLIKGIQPHVAYVYLTISACRGIDVSDAIAALKGSLLINAGMERRDDVAPTVN